MPSLAQVSARNMSSKSWSASPSQGVEVLVLADTPARLGRGAHREHDYVASLPSTILYQYHSVFSQFYFFLN